MDKTLVTVYITNHNYGKFVKQSIKSVLNQTYQNFELIIIDDGSTDNSRAIIEQYENNHKINIVYQERKGLTVSNNIALNLARGEYIMRLDADDYLDKSALKILVDEFDHENIGMVFGDWYVVDEKGVVLEIHRHHDFNSDVAIYDQPAHGACTMFKTKCLRQLNGYDESINRQDGYEIWLRLIEHYTVKNINVPVFYYRHHGSNLTTDKAELLNTRAKILRKYAKSNNKIKPKVVGIVPVRGSSIDSRSQPFIKIKNRYLIDWSLDGLVETEAIDKVIVVSSDKTVLNHIKKNYDKKKFFVQHRTKALSRINTNLAETILHTFDNFDIIDNFDYFSCVFIESPFIRKELIESAISSMQIFNTDSVIGVVQDSRFFFKHTGNGMKPLNYSSDLLKLEKEQWYAAVRGFQLRRVDHFVKTGKFLGNKIGHVVFDKKAAFTIIDEFDTKIAELFLDERYNP